MLIREQVRVRSKKPADIESLCWAIANPTNRRHLEELTSRGLLGFTPVEKATKAWWTAAVFKTALEQGPGYLTGMTPVDPNRNRILSW